MKNTDRNPLVAVVSKKTYAEMVERAMLHFYANACKPYATFVEPEKIVVTKGRLPIEPGQPQLTINFGQEATGQFNINPLAIRLSSRFNGQETIYQVDVCNVVHIWDSQDDFHNGFSVAHRGEGAITVICDIPEITDQFPEFSESLADVEASVVVGTSPVPEESTEFNAGDEEDYRMTQCVFSNGDFVSALPVIRDIVRERGLDMALLTPDAIIVQNKRDVIYPDTIEGTNDTGNFGSVNYGLVDVQLDDNGVIVVQMSPTVHRQLLSIIITPDDKRDLRVIVGRGQVQVMDRELATLMQQHLDSLVIPQESNVTSIAEWKLKKGL